MKVFKQAYNAEKSRKAYAVAGEVIVSKANFARLAKVEAAGKGKAKGATKIPIRPSTQRACVFGVCVCVCVCVCYVRVCAMCVCVLCVCYVCVCVCVCQGQGQGQTEYATSVALR